MDSTNQLHIRNNLTGLITELAINQNRLANKYLIDAIVLCIITGLGLSGNLIMIISIILRKSLRKVGNMFLLHHCLINFVQCSLFVPFILALLNESTTLRGCELLGGTFVTMVTATVLNIAAMTASEAYRFEDLIQQQNQSLYFTTNNNQTPKSNNKMPVKGLPKSIQASSNGTASYTCVIFGLLMIWLSSIILHLGITLIGSDAKQFYNYKIRNCFLKIGDKQTYILYIMWILLTAVSLTLTIVYVKKIYRDVLKRKQDNSQKFFITSPLFYEKQLFINNDTNNKKFQVNRSRKKEFFPSQSYENITSSPINKDMSVNKHCSQLNLNNPNASTKQTIQKSYSKCSFCPDKSIASSSDLSLYKRQQKNASRRFDFLKQILQRIKIQCLVIKLFIICWLPLFLTVLIDIKFKISPDIYRYLTLIAFANSSLTPYCYLTILIPKINKFCLPCLRTDGKQSKSRTKFYNEMERYYEKLGDRMHDISGSKSSLTSANILQPKLEASVEDGPWQLKKSVKKAHLNGLNTTHNSPLKKAENNVQSKIKAVTFSIKSDSN